MDVMDSPKADLKDIIIEARPDRDCLVISPQKNVQKDPLIPHDPRRDPRRVVAEFDNTSPNLKRSLNSLLDIRKKVTGGESMESGALTPPPQFSPVPPPIRRTSTESSRLPSYEEPSPLVNNEDRWPRNSPVRERTPSPQRRSPSPQNHRRRSRSRSRSSRRSSSRDISQNSSRASSATPMPVKINDRRSTKDSSLVEDEWEQMSRDARTPDKAYYFRRENRRGFIGSKERALFLASSGLYFQYRLLLNVKMSRIYTAFDCI